VQLERIVDLAQEGWWSGDLHVHRPLADIEQLMQAEDLHIATVITWWNSRNEWAGLKQLPEHPLIRFDENRYYHVMAGEDEREGGALLFFQLRRPLAITGASREYPSPMEFVSRKLVDSPTSGLMWRIRSGGTCPSGWPLGRWTPSAWPTTTCAAATCTRAKPGVSPATCTSCRRHVAVTHHGDKRAPSSCWKPLQFSEWHSWAKAVTW
jgi:hypothetical protein